tara:strand:+ start:2431 stop:2622 length:192 start_codon:yes stop_codon:yes gene_type:complete
MQKSTSVLRRKLAEIMIARETQINFGTKVKVCSCKLVIDCMKLMVRPTTVAVPRIGMAKISPV